MEKTDLLVLSLGSNKLSLKKAKTELVFFRYPCKHILRDPEIRVNNFKLKLHQFVKYLEAFIDEVLSLEQTN